ncbi:MAG: recombinase RecT [Actinomycetota bacterium]
MTETTLADAAAKKAAAKKAAAPPKDARPKDDAAPKGSEVERSAGSDVLALVQGDAMQQAFAKALPRQLTPERFARIAVTTLRTNPDLLACSQPSLLGALMQAAQLGLEPGSPLGHAYLVPFRNKKTGTREVTFILGYRGMIDLARRSGEISYIGAEVVREGDEFEVVRGLSPDVVHRDSTDQERHLRPITHVYAVAKYRDGGFNFVVLTTDEVEAFRKRSATQRAERPSGPWQTDWEAMAKKTAVRRLSPFLPLSVELATATAADERPIRFDGTDDLIIDTEVVDDDQDETEGDE